MSNLHQQGDRPVLPYTIENFWMLCAALDAIAVLQGRSTELPSTNLIKFYLPEKSTGLSQKLLSYFGQIEYDEVGQAAQKFARNEIYDPSNLMHQLLIIGQIEHDPKQNLSIVTDYLDKFSPNDKDELTGEKRLEIIRQYSYEVLLIYNRARSVYTEHEITEKVDDRIDVTLISNFFNHLQLKNNIQFNLPQLENYFQNQKAVTMVIQKENLLKGSDLGYAGYYLLRVARLCEKTVLRKKTRNHGKPIEEKYPKSARFGLDYSAISVGTGFFIDEGIIATSGHLILKGIATKDGIKKEDLRYVNSFLFNHQTPIVLKDEKYKDDEFVLIPDTNIYVPDTTSEHFHSNYHNYSHIDFALVKVKPARGNDFPTPVIIPQSKKSNLQEKLPVYSIGHGLGLPQLASMDSQVVDFSRKENSYEFSVCLDLYGGNSGSPVFNAKTHELIGLLSRGTPDFEQTQGRLVIKEYKCDDLLQNEICQRVGIIFEKLEVFKSKPKQLSIQTTQIMSRPSKFNRPYAYLVKESDTKYNLFLLFYLAVGNTMEQDGDPFPDGEFTTKVKFQLKGNSPIQEERFEGKLVSLTVDEDEIELKTIVIIVNDGTGIDFEMVLRFEDADRLAGGDSIEIDGEIAKDVPYTSLANPDSLGAHFPYVVVYSSDYLEEGDSKLCSHNKDHYATIFLKKIGSSPVFIESKAVNAHEYSDTTLSTDYFFESEVVLGLNAIIDQNPRRRIKIRNAGATTKPNKIYP